MGIMPLDIDTLTEAVRPFNGGIYGVDPNGAFDVKFSTVTDAASFAASVMSYGWFADIRSREVVRTLHASVTLTVSQL